MTPELSLFFIAWSAGSRAESTSLTFGAEANAERSWAAAGEASWSTQATVMVLLLPEKMSPNRATNRSGNASVQKSAWRSRR